MEPFMPVSLTYPGVYIEEIPSGVHTIIGVSTSTTAFIGRALKGPIDKDGPVIIHSFADFERVFGGLWQPSTMSYAVHQFFQNGGTDAVIVRLVKNAIKAQFNISPDTMLEAKNEGAWGSNLQVSVDYNTKDKDNPSSPLFNITVQLTDPNVIIQGKKKVISTENFRNLTIKKDDPRFIGKVLSQESGLINLVNGTLPTSRPDEIPIESPIAPSTPGADGEDPSYAEYTGSELDKTGFYALEKADIFNLLCVPPLKPSGETSDDIDVSTWNEAQSYCQRRRAFLIIDPPTNWTSSSSAKNDPNLDLLRGAFPEYSAIYFPRVKMADPLKENRLEEFAPCGVVAGVYARTDAQRGVWKAPAGIETGLGGVQELTVKLTDRENGDLNPLGVNCLRNFPSTGNVVWGARTTAGADRLTSEWKYIPIRRLALYIEESLFRGTQWVVFEPNDEPLWSQIRANVGAFMQTLFRQGAFQGRSPREAYFVKCDADTTTQTDRDSGIVNILVGFAPLKPAEFVVIKIQQIAGKQET
jgi:phage tail sheath protein FI